MQVGEIVRLKHIAHHSVRFALVEATTLAARHDACGILTTVLQKTQPFMQLSSGMPLLEQHGNDPTHRVSIARKRGRGPDLQRGTCSRFFFFIKIFPQVAKTHRKRWATPRHASHPDGCTLQQEGTFCRLADAVRAACVVP